METRRNNDVTPTILGMFKGTQIPIKLHSSLAFLVISNLLRRQLLWQPNSIITLNFLLEIRNKYVITRNTRI